MSSLKPTVEPAATSVVVVAAAGVLQVMPGAVTDITGLLVAGWRTEVVEFVEPTMSVVQMSVCKEIALKASRRR